MEILVFITVLTIFGVAIYLVHSNLYLRRQNKLLMQKLDERTADLWEERQDNIKLQKAFYNAKPKKSPQDKPVKKKPIKKKTNPVANNKATSSSSSLNHNSSPPDTNTLLMFSSNYDSGSSCDSSSSFDSSDCSSSGD